MADAADRATADRERAMALFEQSRRDRLAADAAHPPAGVDCIDCGEPIAPARLRVTPNARRCTGCAAFIESSYRREPWT